MAKYSGYRVYGATPQLDEIVNDTEKAKLLAFGSHVRYNLAQVKNTMDDSILLCVKELTSFFEKPIAQKAVKPIRSGVELAVYIDDAGPISLRKNDATLEVLSTAPQNPDMTFRTTPDAVKKLAESTTDDLGEIGVEICKLMLSSDPKLQLRAKVHIGTWDLLKNGYLGIIPLGGPTLMKFLATKGFGSIGKIKEALSRLRG